MTGLAQLPGTAAALAVLGTLIAVLVAVHAYGSSRQLNEARAATVRMFLRALEAKDPYTARHTERVANYATYIAEQLGWRRARVDRVRQAALMHDIGKLAVAPRLLNKPALLTEHEYAEIRRHNEVCVGILSRVEFLRSTIPVASDRHAHFDAHSGGSDHGATEGFIVAVADAFDAMTSTRAYRKALSQDVAFEELRKGRGAQFDPACVDALIAAIQRRGEVFGAGHEVDLVVFEVEPPLSGVGSAGLGDLDLRVEPVRAAEGRFADVREPEGSAVPPW